MSLMIGFATIVPLNGHSSKTSFDTFKEEKSFNSFPTNLFLITVHKPGKELHCFLPHQ